MKKVILVLVTILLFNGCGGGTDSSDEKFGSKTIKVFAAPGSMTTTNSSLEITLNISEDITIAKYSIDGTNPKTEGTDFIDKTKINITPSDTAVLKLYVSNGEKEETNSYYYKNGTAPSLISDFNGIRMYQIMVESFQDGASCGYSSGYGPSSLNGDLRGIINALDYIKSLNVNAIWLTPIFNSESTDIKMRATGYYCDDYFNVDPNFGTNEDFRELVNKAHEKGLYVFLDGVFGHHGVADIEGVTNLAETGTIGYATTFPASLDFYKEVATYWIENYEIDGWRLDQAYQLYQNNINYWKNIREAVETKCQERKNSGNQWGILGYMVGEVWDSNEVIAKTGYSNNGLYSCFDFPTRYNLVQTLATQENITQDGAMNQPASNLNIALNNLKSFPFYAKPNLMLTNHDLVRFGDLIQRAKFGYGVENEDYWLRHKAAMSFLAAYTGPITIYYGDEIGEEVENFINEKDSGYYNDHVSRSQGRISNLNSNEANLKEYVSNLMALRNTHPALWNGSRENIMATTDIFADLKSYNGEEIIYILNTATSDKTLDFSSSKIGNCQLKNLFTGESVSSSTITAKRLTGSFFIKQ